METLEHLQRRIDSATGLQGVVRTMKTLSAVGLRRFEAASHAIRAYDAVVELGLCAVLRETRWDAAPDAEPPAGPRALIAIGADHGLCGRFDEAVAERTRTAARAEPAGVLVAAVGLRLADRLSAGRPSENRAAPAATLRAPGSVAGLAETADALLVQLDAWRREPGVAGALLIRNVQATEAPARPVETTLLPVAPSQLAHWAARPWPGRGRPMRADDRDAVLARLIRQHLFVQVYRALAESLAAEHAARLAVMQGAERSIADHLDAMQAAFRSRRQEAITGELLEVAAGFAALGGGKD